MGSLQQTGLVARRATLGVNMSRVLLIVLFLSTSAILSLPIFNKILRPLYPFIHSSQHSNIRIKPIKTHTHPHYKPAPEAYAPPPPPPPPAPSSYAPPPPDVPETYKPEPVVYETTPPEPAPYEPSPSEPAPPEPAPYRPAPPAPTPYVPAPPSYSPVKYIRPEHSTIRFASFDVSLPEEQPAAEVPEPVQTTAKPPTTTAVPILIKDIVDIKQAIVEDAEQDISELPLEAVLEMAKDPEAEIAILEIAVEKIKEVQAQEPSVSDPAIEKEAMELPMEVLLEMAEDPEAKEEILEAAVVRLEETIEEKVKELPLEEV